MYRTPNIEDKKLIALISKELMNGFKDLFALDSDKDMISTAVQEFCEVNKISLKTKLDLDLYICKIVGMYQELADANALYTFDEHGEWILSRILLSEMSMFESFLDDNETDDESEDEASIEDFWVSALTDEEIEYVEAYAEEYFSGLSTEMQDEFDISELDTDKQLFIDRVCNFPLMALEITEDLTPEFLFWDRDFLLFDEYGPENFENIKSVISKTGFNMDFSGVTEQTQLLTGSQKYELE